MTNKFLLRSMFIRKQGVLAHKDPENAIVAAKILSKQNLLNLMKIQGKKYSWNLIVNTKTNLKIPKLISSNKSRILKIILCKI